MKIMCDYCVHKEVCKNEDQYIKLASELKSLEKKEENKRFSTEISCRDMIGINSGR